MSEGKFWGPGAAPAIPLKDIPGEGARERAKTWHDYQIRKTQHIVELVRYVFERMPPGEDEYGASTGEAGSDRSNLHEAMQTLMELEDSMHYSFYEQLECIASTENDREALPWGHRRKMCILADTSRGGHASRFEFRTAGVGGPPASSGAIPPRVSWESWGAAARGSGESRPDSSRDSA